MTVEKRYTGLWRENGLGGMPVVDEQEIVAQAVVFAEGCHGWRCWTDGTGVGNSMGEGVGELMVRLEGG